MADVGYRLRPSKAILRRMIIDVCRRLSNFAQLTDYQYVGFGGLEFADFDLIHRDLGITKMISIEGDPKKFDRCIFNAPFKTIDVLSGRASEQLSQIDWSELSIVWLDYEGKLNVEIQDDIALLCRSLQPGSALFVTVNAVIETEIEGRRDRLALRLGGEEFVPPGVTDETLGVWGLANVQHQVLSELIAKTLRERIVEAEWRQVLDIHYADNAKMQTIGGVVVSAGTRRAFDSCGFSELDFVRFEGNEPLLLRVPVLTLKERRAIEEHLPLGDDKFELAWLSEGDKKDYMQVYRYFADGRLPT